MLLNAEISHVKAPPRLQKSLKVKSPQPKKKTEEGVFNEELAFDTVINPGHVVITLPLRTLSPNQSEPWRKRYAREKAQRRAVMFAMIAVKEQIPQMELSGSSGKIRLKFTRYAPKGLDAHDNLPMSVKKICDQVCAEIMCDYVPGRADGAGCFEFEYDQVKTKGKIYGVKIEIRY